MDNTDFTHTRQRLLKCKIYHHILPNHSEMSSCQIDMLMQGALSFLVFEREPTTKPKIMLKEVVIYLACANETSTIVLDFRSTNTSSKRKYILHFRLKF